MGNPLKKALEFISTSTSSRTISVIVILIIAAAIPLTVIVSQKQQEIRQRASTGQCFVGSRCATKCVGCDRYNMSCDVTFSKTCSIRGSLDTANDPTCGSSCGGGTPTPTPCSGVSSCSNNRCIFLPVPGVCGITCSSDADCLASTPTPTRIPTPTTLPGVTATPTPTRTVTPTPQPTIPAGNTVFALTIGLDGLGSTGDNANPENSSGSNKNPNRKSRNAAIGVFASDGNSITNKSGTINYDTESGKFIGSVDLGTLESGNYNVKVKSDGYLRRLASGIQNVTAGQIYSIPAVNLVAGDINGDNAINILDYNILISCSVFGSDNHEVCDKNPDYKTLSDLDDNGTVNQFDYNLFIRELSVQKGN